jgi:hypothetical protein
MPVTTTMMMGAMTRRSFENVIQDIMVITLSQVMTEIEMACGRSVQRNHQSHTFERAADAQAQIPTPHNIKRAFEKDSGSWADHLPMG